MSLQPFELLDSRVRDFREKVLPEALTTFAELFLMSGDRNAFFYTGSQAMHSDKIMIFEVMLSSLAGQLHVLACILGPYFSIVKVYNKG